MFKSSSSHCMTLLSCDSIVDVQNEYLTTFEEFQTSEMKNGDITSPHS